MATGAIALQSRSSSSRSFCLSDSGQCCAFGAGRGRTLPRDLTRDETISALRSDFQRCAAIELAESSPEGLAEARDEAVVIRLSEVVDPGRGLAATAGGERATKDVRAVRAGQRRAHAHQESTLG